MLPTSKAILRIKGLQRNVARTLKTKYTVVYNLKTNKDAGSSVGDSFLSEIKVVDGVLNSICTNKSLLYQNKYKNIPSLISSGDINQIQYVLNNLIESRELGNALTSHKTDIQGIDSSKLGMLALRLLLDCCHGQITQTVSYLVYYLVKKYNAYPYKDTIVGMKLALEEVRSFLDENKVILKGADEINNLVDQLLNSDDDKVTVKRVLKQIDYKLFSEDVVRVMRGKKTFDEIEVSKGWKSLSGILDTNEQYIKSIDLPTKKLVSISDPMLVLVYDGILREANKILPTLTYMNKCNKSLLLVVSGDCVGDALTAITINNNKNKRGNKSNRTIIMKYNSVDNNNMSIQENSAFIEFLKLPNQMTSIYSPLFSEQVPSTVSASRYYGSIESLKGTNGEIFLYNPPIDNMNEDVHFSTTVTLNVGGHSELEINQRRDLLDTIINDTLCHGLFKGFIPNEGVALVKSMPKLEKLMTREDVETCLNKKIGVESVLSLFPSIMERSLMSRFGYNKYQVTSLVRNTLADPNMMAIYRDISLPTCSSIATEKGLLEPWDKMDKMLSGVISYIQMLNSVQIVITRILEKPKKTRPS